MAPIIVFAFNRRAALERTIAALAVADGAKDSDLYVFVDGPREGREGEADKVNQVRDYVTTITGFRSVTHTFAEVNRGLGPSIIAGVTDVIHRHGTAIVVEDDLIVSRSFLTFMNAGLERYKGEQRVFSVCGYSNTVTIPEGYDYDAYFCVRSSSWGWATWADRWESVDWELRDWDSHRRNARAFNRWGGSDCWKMLRDWHEGRNKSWAIRFCYAQYIQNKVSLFPTTSKVDNEGFDGEGTNCKKWSRFRCVFDNTSTKTFRLPTAITINPTLYRSAMRYHTIAIRIYSKIMYLIHR